MPTHSAEPAVVMTDVHKSYRGGAVQALRGAGLTVARGELVAVTGPSGSGKSTLLNVLGLLDTPTAGSYVLLGRETSTMRDGERTRLRATAFGFVFQQFHLIQYKTALENVATPLVHRGVRRAHRRTRSLAALDEVGVAHLCDARPATLSGGEQQRVAVARAIVGEPVILLCDEPTGNLDSENTARLLAVLRAAVTPHRAVVVVTHDPDVAASADRTVRIVDGVDVP